MDIERRNFLKITALAAAVSSLGGAPEMVEKRNGMPYRVLGKTNEHVSLLSLGGAHIGRNTLSTEQSITLQRIAIDEGVNFLDNAYVYNGGRSEELMGKALRDGYRNKVFLMTKTYTEERDGAGAQKQLEESLKRLQTDHLDLWQVHQIMQPHEPQWVYERGILDILAKAREEGKVRYVGFTGHARPEYHLEMIKRGFDWDTVQMPINAVDHHWTSFQKSVLPEAKKRNLGIIAMKSLGGSPGQFVNKAKVLTARECLHYAMNLPVAAVVSGIDSMEKLRENLAAAKSFEPLSEEQIASILAKAAPIAEGGKFEPYKRKTVA
ncbi:MAG: aldo/keto reductase [Candidatus Hydrogenedentota bacterium]